MKAKINLLLCCFLIPIITTAQNWIHGYEYWFNHDESSKIQVTVAPAMELSVNTNISTNGLISGMNTFHFRTWDSEGKFSVVYSKPFYNTPQTLGNEAVVSMEYWFNNDYADKEIVSVSQGQTIELNDLLSTTTLKEGMHIFNARFLENTGMSSSVLSRFFYNVPTTASGGAEELIQMEYWFGNDYDDKVVVNVAQNQLIDVDEFISTSHLKEGAHILNVRFLENTDFYSSVLSRVFMVSPTPLGTENTVTTFRYWIDDEFDAVQTNDVMPSVEILELDSSYSMAQIPTGNYAVHFQFKDDLGNWSQVVSEEFYKFPLPVAQFNADTTIFCASTSSEVQFINNSIDADQYLWNFGDGNTSTDANPIHQYTAAGLYDVSLLVTDTQTGLDSLYVWQEFVKIYETPPTTIEVDNGTAICEGETTILTAFPGFSYDWSTGASSQSIQVDEAGQYWATIFNPNLPSCISESEVVTIEVFAVPSNSVAVAPSLELCEGETATLTASSDYLYAWNTNETSQSIEVGSTGAYWVDVINPLNTNCFSTSEIFEFLFNPLPEAAFSFEQNDYEVTFTSTSSAADSHFWDFGDGNNSEQLSPTHTYSAPELFEVMLIVENACGSDTTYQFIDLIYLSTEEMMEHYDLSVHPNPSQGIFHLTVDAKLLQERYTILDYQGRIIEQGVLNDIQSQLDLSQNQSGFYLLLIQDRIFRLVKQ